MWEPAEAQELGCAEQQKGCHSVFFDLVARLCGSSYDPSTFETDGEDERFNHPKLHSDPEDGVIVFDESSSSSLSSHQSHLSSWVSMVSESSTKEKESDEEHFTSQLTSAAKIPQKEDKSGRKLERQANIEEEKVDEKLLRRFLQNFGKGVKVKIHRTNKTPKKRLMWVQNGVLWWKKVSLVSKIPVGKVNLKHQIDLEHVQSIKLGKLTTGFSSKAIDACCLSIFTKMNVVLDIEFQYQFQRNTFAEGMLELLRQTRLNTILNGQETILPGSESEDDGTESESDYGN
mmetsp:Transcript_22905/g.29913  ORF Transcript_22905/g.29913 Transcript_22905/m.29913 type:complete len:288 (-) Transcript_22905:379-1242(-)